MEILSEPKLIKTTATVEKEDWDLVIEPKAGLFAIKLREIWHYRDLLILFVKRDLTAQYKQTILGPLWHVIQPVLTTLTFLVVFHKIAGIRTDGIEPVLFYMSGITIWNYFTACFTHTSNTFVGNAGIFGKVYFPRLVLPLSALLSNMVRLGIQFSLLLAVMFYLHLVNGTPIAIGFHWLLLPVIILLMAGTGLGLGIIISSLTTKYRDLGVLVGFGIQLLMYATPVAYPLSFLKSKSILALVSWNPLSSVVEGFRYALFGTNSYSITSLGYSVMFVLLVLLVGAVLFSRVERTFMDTV
ncbi:ABC transporter permease [Flavisolibacter nicotianae]|uniref:ABC transporter permease n=1 Tax=Flavisolibacter nicotianae TaxID=2364882 RepID=UPI001F0906E6|nr:ABC transporter permease [Flavisolibacter nicotianae]